MTSSALAVAGSVPAVLLMAQPAPLLVGLWTLPLAVQLRLQSELARSAGRFRIAFVLPLVQQLVMLGAAAAAVELARDGISPARALLLPALGAIVVLPWQRTGLPNRRS